MDPISFTLSVITLVLLVFYIYYCLTYDQNFHNYPPGPKWVPFVGNSVLLNKMSKQYGGTHKAFAEMAKTYKTNVLGLTLGMEYYIIILSEDLIKEVFTRDEFQARPDNFFIRLRSMGTKKGITMTDGLYWQEQRQFLVRHLRNLGFGRTVMESLIHDELKGLYAMLGDGSPKVHLSQHLPKSVLNVLWAIATGSMFKSGDTKLENLHNYMLQRSKAFDMAGGILSQMPWLRFIAPEKFGYNLIIRLNNELSQIIKQSINEHKKTYDKGITRDFIDAFLHEMNTQNSPNSTFTEEQLIMVCLDLFIAGSMTTSDTLDFALLQMIKYPLVQQKVHAEINSVLTPGQMPKISDRTMLPYVEAVLTESQRFSHVVPLNGPRRVLEDTTISGYFVPKGTTVLMCLESIRKDPVKFKDPYSFRPERFLNEKGEFLSECQFYPFGFGKRRCPGEALAKNFLFIFFTGLLHTYKLSVVEGTEPPNAPPIGGISLRPAPYSLCLSKQSS